MARAFGLVLLLISLYIGMEIYTKGIDKLGTTQASSIPVPLLVLAGLGTLLLISAAGLAVHKRLAASPPRPSA